ncbi:bombesin receptor-activated protein C6orf89 homolog [Xyrauchen texanus]|uniref:bombesin receptor-activated protein C6orf89 homolog n=1 Tax=Xyrauchen texanus TaxID=154827 RepID=UPI00224262CF|nr:bombesin receptor-activated protein C6orf89 homolog [Xyrauchen texanus]
MRRRDCSAGTDPQSERVCSDAQRSTTSAAEGTATAFLSNCMSLSLLYDCVCQGGESVSQRVCQEQFSSYNSRFTSVSRPDTFTQTPANFTVVRSFTSSHRETFLQWLFPDAELCPLLDNTGTTLQHCQLTDNTSSWSRNDDQLYSALLCCRECRFWVGWLLLTVLQPFGLFLFNNAKNTAAPSTCLEPGDTVYADPLMELFPGRDQNFVCDVPML